MAAAALPPASSAPWQPAQTAPSPSPSIASPVGLIAWFSWQTAHPGTPIWTNTFACTLLSNSSAVRLWHCPHALPTQETPGGAAPWLPWQSLQVGADRSPFSDIVAQWMLVRYFATWSVAILYGCMWAGSAWQRPQVSATRSGWTLDFGSAGGRIACGGWQLVQTATLASPCSRRRRPWTEVRYSAT